MSLKDAREKRDAARKLIAGGVNPSEARQAEKSSRLGSAANSFEVVAREWWASHMANKAPTHIDLETGEWRYFVNKTKTDHLVPLPTQAIKILMELKSFSGDGQYVFQGGHSPLKSMSESAVNAALKRMGYDTKTQITGHGFRAMDCA